MLKHVEDKNKYVSYEEKMTRENLFKLCYYSTYMTFKYLFDEKKEKIDVSKLSDTDKAIYDLSNSPTSPFNAPKDCIYYALKKLCNEEYFTAKNEIQNFERYVRVLTSFFFENNSSGIDSIFKRVDSKSPSILNENIFGMGIQ